MFIGRASLLIIVRVIKGYKPSKLTRSIGNMFEMVLVPLAIMMMDDDANIIDTHVVSIKVPTRF